MPFGDNSTKPALLMPLTQMLSAESARISQGKLATVVPSVRNPAEYVMPTERSFGGALNTATSSSILITIAAGFGVTAPSASLAFPSSGYQQAQTFLTIDPGGQGYTLTFACSGLPAKLSCAFSPTSLPLSGVTAQQTVQMLVSNSNATASLHQPSFSVSRTVTLRCFHWPECCSSACIVAAASPGS